VNTLAVSGGYQIYLAGILIHHHLPMATKDLLLGLIVIMALLHQLCSILQVTAVVQV
jgi:hypothetical protein